MDRSDTVATIITDFIDNDRFYDPGVCVCFELLVVLLLLLLFLGGWGFADPAAAEEYPNLSPAKHQ